MKKSLLTLTSILLLSSVSTIANANVIQQPTELMQENIDIMPTTVYSVNETVYMTYPNKNDAPNWLDYSKNYIVPDLNGKLISLNCSGSLRLITLDYQNNSWKATYQGVLYGYY